MTSSFFRWAGAFLVLSISFTSCTDNEGCTDSNAINYDAEATLDDGSCVYNADGQFDLQFDLRLGNDPFALSQVATNWEGRKMSFNRAQFYVSGISLGEAEFPEKYLLVTPNSTEFEIGQLGAGHYHDLKFNVGIDSEANHADPALWPIGHALSSNNPDHSHWGWDPGFIFITVEGLVDTTADMTGEANAPFLFHIGLDSFLKTVELESHTNSAGGAFVSVSVDWLKFFEGIDLREGRSTHTMNNMPLAMAFRNNIVGAFTINMALQPG